MEWTESICLITGASSGIGRATAVEMARRGARVIAVARREDRLASLVEELGGAPHSYIVCDVSDLEQIRAMARTVVERTDHIDALINNAGVPSVGPISRSSPEEVERVIKTNLLGPIWCIQELLPPIRKALSPVIVNLASKDGRIPIPGTSTYNATKFGLVGVTESIWGEMKHKGIHSMVVNPGFVDTEGFPMAPLLASPLTRWLVMDPARVARAICAGMERRATEVRVQGFWHPLYFVTIILGPWRRRIADGIWQLIGKSVRI
jgi:short-subunit dehydrogenase